MQGNRQGIIPCQLPITNYYKERTSRPDPQGTYLILREA